ncbi:hypothetical protein EJ08DRAFT_691005 [Tothia fuscella]|uniref:Zn(2)-C6 fungal-type domain-containing protein n=1 Tax=Tothia fuscella TaxID=1048955 RepID=A0A9P4TS40_9PEZI|nr:hypothetical protein EJ08DRAFT_691005 [Tothia fuscella]
MSACYERDQYRLSRRRSCLACIQRKRKCDRTWPKCQRCVARASQCLYPNEIILQPQQSINFDAVQSVPALLPPRGQPSSSWQLQQYPTEPSLLFTGVDGGSPFESHFHPSNSRSMLDDDFIFGSIEDDVSRQLLQSSAQSNIIQAIPSNSSLQRRVQYVAKRLATIPRTFAERGQTSFIHRMQFQLRNPLALQDAMSMSALYCLKNAENQPLVFQALEDKCQQLITSTNALLTSKLDLLAALQALLVYQIMRLFDGDIRLRAHAEVDEQIMNSWGDKLKAHMDNGKQTTPAELNTLNTGSMTIDYETEWQSWLVDESIRRTMITASMLKGVYNFLKLGHDSPTELRVRFTAQVALWTAQSEVCWRRTLEEKGRFEVWVTQWDEEMTEARPDDLDELGIMIMTMLWGPVATRKWLGQELTTRYGLDMA